VTAVGYADRVRGWRLRAWYVAVRSWLGAIPLSLFLLAIRIGVAMVFFTSGQIKLITWDFTIRLFTEEFKLPVIPSEIAATLAAFCELTFPPFIIVGFATRLATLPLVGMLVVIQTLVYPDSWPDTLFWGSSLLFILSRGAGVFSIDYVIERAIVTGSPRLALFAAGLLATAASIALWYFAYNSQARATLSCLFTVVAECAGMTGRAPIAPYLPANPMLVWLSLAITAIALVWMAVSGEFRLLRPPERQVQVPAGG
jgi:putative oxidoreductase